VSRDRTLVRASDLSAWAYCNRAWWLATVQGIEHQHPELLAAGSALHNTHGDHVRTAAFRKSLGVALILVALAALLFVLVLQLW
jgi:hypothetical protein